MKIAIVFLFAAVAAATTCQKGEYQTQDGRCFGALVTLPIGSGWQPGIPTDTITAVPMTPPPPCGWYGGAVYKDGVCEITMTFHAGPESAVCRWTAKQTKLLCSWKPTNQNPKEKK
jgi:hypothetical protein